MSQIDKNQDRNITGKNYWRSLEQLASTPEYKEKVAREFGEDADIPNNAWSRRSFLTLMGASAALAGLAGCRKPVDKIVPYVKQPEEILPGFALQYATAMPWRGGAYGLLVETHTGRPTKVEGNELHPATRGKSNSFAQAAILNLYDPDRSQQVLENRKLSDYANFVQYWAENKAPYDDNGGEGLAVLADEFNSPTMNRLKRQFEETYPNATWVTWNPVADENQYDGIRAATGNWYQPVYHLDKANVILSIDNDLFLMDPQNITSAKGFADGRRMPEKGGTMNRLWVAEAAFSITGSMADHRLRLKPRDLERFVVALAAELQNRGLNIDGAGNLPDVASSAIDTRWLQTVAKDLMANRGRSLVAIGQAPAPAIHALVVAINDALGNEGNTVTYHDAPDQTRSSTPALVNLVQQMRDGAVSTLFILGGNPVYNAPADLNFRSALAKVKTTVHLSYHVDETSYEGRWHIPRAHFLESWSDVRTFDGTLSVVQPLIEPLYNGKSEVEFLNLIATGESVTANQLVKQTWQPVLDAGPIDGRRFDVAWRKVLHDGVHTGSAASAASLRVNSNAIASALNDYASSLNAVSGSGYDVVFMPSHSVLDGSYANNGWMQELPDPVSKVAWDNAALMSKQTADELNVSSGDVVTVSAGGRQIELPAWVVPGWAPGAIGLELGYGRVHGGRVANDVGVDCYPLRTSTDRWSVTGAGVVSTGRRVDLANTQDHNVMEGRPLVRETSFDKWSKGGDFKPEQIKTPPLVSLWDEHKYDKGYQWGMAIDLTACVGCNACTIACQAENNIPIVGKEQVRNGREMHWIRIDRYYGGDTDNPDMVHQPVGCQHCEMAPCEQVCPVAATVHDDEGLNVMVYNRCIGTRYCSNNCPFKVRRFNFFNYTKDTPEVVQMAMNPDVTVRTRGVMEKCTYCVQRINRARIEAKKEERQIRDGEVVAACQQACPADAIHFGNINDPNSKVSKIKQDERNYVMLDYLNIKTRTTFMGKLRNPHPDLEPTGQASNESH